MVPALPLERHALSAAAWCWDLLIPWLVVSCHVPHAPRCFCWSHDTFCSGFLGPYGCMWSQLRVFLSECSILMVWRCCGSRVVSGPVKLEDPWGSCCSGFIPPCLGSTGLCSPVLLHHVARGPAWHIQNGLCVKYLSLSSAVMELLHFL